MIGEENIIVNSGQFGRHTQTKTTVEVLWRPSLLVSVSCYVDTEKSTALGKKLGLIKSVELQLYASVGYRFLFNYLSTNIT